jgi:flagellar hook-associated protein 2
MSSIQFGGVVSGLNTQGIIDALVAAEKQPLTALQNKESTLTAQKTAYGQLGTAMDDVVAAIKNFTVTGAGSSRSASSSNSSVLSAVAGTGAAVASYQVTVNRLATATHATSIAAVGSAVTTTINPLLLLKNANLAAPITKGNMALTVDGQTVQVAVDPDTDTLSSAMTKLSSALTTQLQLTDPTATATASIVGSKMQIAIAGTTNHSVSFGDALNDASNMAAALGLDSQTVANQTSATVKATAYLDQSLASLNLPGTVTAGQISAIVDGTIVHYTVADPAATTLNQVMDGLGKAISDQLVAGGNGKGADAAAAMTVSVAGNRLQLAMTGATLTHSISFGAGSDASNALGILGIDNQSATNAMNPTLTGATNLGVARTLGALDGAGLSGLTSTATGVLTINGVDIAYDTTADSLGTIISRINNSNAGVVASLDRSNDKILLARKDTGAVAIDITDTNGTLGAALKLSPGNTNAQTIGLTAQVTVDGRAITSTSNTVSNAIDSLTLNLLGQSPVGETETLTVGVNQSAVQTALSSFVTAFNSLADTLDSLTSATPGTSGGTAGTAGPLSGDPTVRTMLMSLRQTVFSTSGSGTLNSLGALGINTGAVGAVVGTTNRLQLDTTALSAAMTSDPNAVANLLDKSTGPMAALLGQMQNYEDPSNTDSYVQASISGIASDITDVKAREDYQQMLVDNYTTMIEAQYTAMETTLSLLQSQSQQVAAQLGYTTSSSGSGVSNSSTSS